MQIQPSGQTVKQNRMETEIEEKDAELDNEARLLIRQPVNIGSDILKHASRNRWNSYEQSRVPHINFRK
jgi:hypothetical protein